MLTIIMLNLALAAPSVQAPAAAGTPQTLTLPDGVNRPAASIQDSAWLAGTWHGTGLGGTVDEVWSAPAGGAMVGHFRLIKGSKPVFYEIMTLVEVGGSVEMRLKHVNPGMTGWEEKNGFVTFRLAKNWPAKPSFSTALPSAGRVPMRSKSFSRCAITPMAPCARKRS